MTFDIITLWQPWASLVVCGRKTNETRPRPFPAARIGKRIAIHAALKRVPLRMMSEEMHEICLDEFGCSYNHTLPYGSVVGSVLVVDNSPTDIRAGFVSSDELAMGDWRAGRWSIGLAEPEQFKVILPHKGKQGWGKWTDPRLRTTGDVTTAELEPVERAR